MKIGSILIDTYYRLKFYQFAFVAETSLHGKFLFAKSHFTQFSTLQSS